MRETKPFDESDGGALALRAPDFAQTTERRALHLAELLQMAVKRERSAVSGDSR